MGLCGTKSIKEDAKSSANAPEEPQDNTPYGQLFQEPPDAGDNGQFIRAALLRIWDEADANKDGELSYEENRSIIPKYLRALQEGMMKIISSKFKSTVEAAIEEFRRQDQLDAAEQTEKMYQVIVEQYMPKIREYIYQEVSAVNIDQLAKEALKEMDANSNGKVDREEFITKFMAAMNKLVRVKVILEQAPIVSGLETYLQHMSAQTSMPMARLGTVDTTVGWA